MNAWTRVALLALPLAALLSGCATTATVQADNARLNATASNIAHSLTHPVASSLFEVSNGFSAARRPLPVAPKNPDANLPGVFNRAVVMQHPSPIGLVDLARRIQEGLGIQVVIDPSLLTVNGAAQSAAAAAPTPTAATSPLLPPLPEGAAAPAAPSAIGTVTAARQSLVLPSLSYRGSLAGLLNAVCNSLGLSWKWDGATVQVFRYETRFFHVSILNDGNVQATATMSQSGTSSSSGGMGGSSMGGSSMGGAGGASGGTGGGTATANLTSQSSYDPWKDIEKTIKSLVEPVHGKVMALPSLGSIMVRATPAVLAQVAQAVVHFNDTMTRQVLVNIQIYSVANNRQDSNGLNWNILWKNASKYGIALTSPPSLASSGGMFTFNQTSGNFNGSQGILSLLSSAAPSTLLTQSSELVMNGQSVQINKLSQVFYIASSSSSALGGTALSNVATTSLTPGSIETGTQLSVTPRVLPNGKVLIQFALNISSNQGIQTFQSGSSVIQLPKVESQAIMQQAAIPSGMSVGLSGMTIIDNQDGHNGILAPSMWLLGGSENATRSTSTIVIVATPTVINLK